MRDGGVGRCSIVHGHCLVLCSIEWVCVDAQSIRGQPTWVMVVYASMCYSEAHLKHGSTGGCPRSGRPKKPSNPHSGLGENLVDFAQVRI